MYATIINGYLFDLITEELLETIETIEELEDTIIFQDFTVDGMYEVIIHTTTEKIASIENLLAPLM